MPDFLTDPTLIRSVKVLGILVGAFLLTRLARVAIGRFEKRFTEGEPPAALETIIHRKRAQTLGSLLRTALAILIWLVAGLTVLDQVGVNVGPLIAAAGIGGIALGFGAQNLVRDVIAGFFILLESQYDVGDVVRVADVSGAVEEIKLRTTILRDLQGIRHVVPNGEVRVSSNLTKGFSRYLIDLPVPYEEDVDKAIELARQAAEEMRAEDEFRDEILGPLEVLGVDNYGESSIDVKLYVETQPGEQWRIGRELRKRIKKAYDRAGVSIPYPHREVIMRQADSQQEQGE